MYRMGGGFEGTQGFNLAGLVTAKELNSYPLPPPEGRERHRYGNGPFARLKMPELPTLPGVYLWVLEGDVVYVGQTRGSLRGRLGPGGYSTITTYNTFGRQPGRTNGGQQTNCRINELANRVLDNGRELSLWYRITESGEAALVESKWMATFGVPPWNQRDEGVANVEGAKS